MTYGGYLLRHPLFWSFLCGLAVGVAVATATRRPCSFGRSAPAAPRRWAIVWLALSVAVVAAAGGMIAPAEPATAHPIAPAVAAVGLGVGFSGLRFPRSMGVPILLLLGSFAFFGALLVRDFVPVRTQVSPARVTVLAVRESGLTLEVSRDAPDAAAQPAVVSVPDQVLRAEIDLLDVPDTLFLLGARRFVRYLGPAGDRPTDHPIVQAAVDRGIVRLERVCPEISRVNVHRTYALLIEPISAPRFSVE